MTFALIDFQELCGLSGDILNIIQDKLKSYEFESK